MASFLDARAHDGIWLVRMEDLDTDRVQPGAADQILRDLEAFGLRWDGEVLRQTQRLDAYRAAFHQLEEQALVYKCVCSRRQAAGRCTGLCRTQLVASSDIYAWRVRVPDEEYEIDDAVQGRFSHNPRQAAGDFVIKRSDGPFAYQLAVVVDDAAQSVTNVVRGADLLDNSPRQIFLQQRLHLPTPFYAHVPVAVDEQGAKLSKSTGAAALDFLHPALELRRALECLGHTPPTNFTNAPVSDLLAWGIVDWQLERVPRHLTVHCR